MDDQAEVEYIEGYPCIADDRCGRCRLPFTKVKRAHWDALSTVDGVTAWRPICEYCDSLDQKDVPLVA